MSPHKINSTKHEEECLTTLKRPSPAADDLTQIAAGHTPAPSDPAPRKQPQTCVRRRSTIPQVARSGRQPRRSRRFWNTPRSIDTGRRVATTRSLRPDVETRQQSAEMEPLSAPPPASPGHDRSTTEHVEIYVDVRFFINLLSVSCTEHVLSI